MLPVTLDNPTSPTDEHDDGGGVLFFSCARRYFFLPSAKQSNEIDSVPIEHCPIQFSPRTRRPRVVEEEEEKKESGERVGGLSTWCVSCAAAAAWRAILPWGGDGPYLRTSAVLIANCSRHDEEIRHRSYLKMNTARNETTTTTPREKKERAQQLPRH